MSESSSLIKQDDWLRAAGRMLIILLATAVILRVMGRVFWCECGSPVPWAWDINSQHNSQHLIDPYFFTHILHGLMFYVPLHWLGRPRSLQNRFWAAIFLEAAWEVLENTPIIIDRYRTVTISLGYYGDSIANAMIDIVACAAGYWLASCLKVWQSVVLFIGTELLLAIFIRDGLLLNILMLLIPIDAVLQWQQGA